MTALLSATAGLALLLVLLVDVFRTVLAPTLKGPISYGLSVALTAGARRLPRRWRGRAAPYVGPVTVLAGIVTWVLVLWLGFVLLYLPVLDEVALADGDGSRAAGLLDAVYLSGAALTTVGFGDVAGASGRVRLLTVAESALGLALFTAAIGYLPAIYTVISQVRSACRDTSDLGAQDAAGAARLVLRHPPGMERLRRDLIEVRQHLLRFPVLHYFRPPDPESPWQLLRSGAAVCAVVCWSLKPGTVPGQEVLAPALRRALEASLDEAGGHVDVPEEVCRRHRDEAREQLAASRTAVEELQPGAAESGPVPDEAVELLARAAAHVRAYGAWTGVA